MDKILQLIREKANEEMNCEAKRWDIMHTYQDTAPWAYNDGCEDGKIEFARQLLELIEKVEK